MQEFQSIMRSSSVEQAEITYKEALPNSILHADLLIPTVREEVTKHSIANKDKLRQHPNQLIPILLEEQERKRLKRYNPFDLTHRFS